MSTDEKTNPAGFFKPVEDYPEYWLGQVKAVADMERSGTFTRSQMVNEIHRIMQAMDKHSQIQLLRTERILRKEPT